MTLLSFTKYSLFGFYIFSIAYTQYRGKVKLKFFQQLANHSAIMAPINVLMYLSSRLKNQPYYDLNDFPIAKALQNHWQTFREEAEILMASGYIKVAEQNNDMGFNSFFKRGWKRFYLKWYSQAYLPSAEALCPKTVSILKRYPEIKGAMFTLLPKNGKLKPHRDPYAGSLRYHLGLITPNSPACYIDVDGERYAWKDGEAVIFDETYIHSAKNETQTDRIIFFCDLERPLKYRFAQAINRFFSSHIMKEAATQNLPDDPVGHINQLFFYYHRLILNPLRQIKKKAPLTFKITQYSLLLLLAYLLIF